MHNRKQTDDNFMAVIRHGERVSSLKDKPMDDEVNKVDDPLTANGVLMAKQTGQYLSGRI